MSFADLLKRPIFIFLSILNNSCIKSTPFEKIEFLYFEFFSNSKFTELSKGKPKSNLFFNNL